MTIDISKYVNSYEFDFTLPGSGEVIMFKPITTGQLKKLLPYENEKNTILIEELLDSLIKDCVVTEGFDINKIYLQDRFSLMIEIRKKSKGSEYEFIYTCPDCGTRSPITLDLNDLKIIPKEDFKIFKINEKLSVDLDHLTRGDQKTIFDLVEKMKIKNENLKNAEMSTYSYAKSMKLFHTPEGDTDVDIKDKVNMLDNVFTEKQYKDFLEILQNGNFGYDFTFDFECSNEECRKKENYAIPLKHFFA